MGYHPHLIDTDIRDIMSCPRSPPPVRGREDTTNKTVVSLLGILTVLTPILGLHGCLTPRKFALSVKEGVA